MFNLLTYFLGACIGEGVVEMDVWIRIFAEKLRIIFKVCFRRKEKGRSAKCGSVWREVRGSKITENVRTSLTVCYYVMFAF